MTDDLISIHTCHAECPRPLCVAQRTIATQQEAIDEMIRGWATVQALIGNVDHLRGHGPSAAEMRGGMLNDIRDIAAALLSKHGQRT